MDSFNEIVYAVVRKIPKGKVLNYGAVARLAGRPRCARAAGYALSACPRGVPAHRVVFKDGGLSPAFMRGGKNMQYVLLKAEKVAFTKDKKVNMKKHNRVFAGVSLI
jgi:methylated-DNA-protein-cysteine methyltransferase-like protein